MSDATKIYVPRLPVVSRRGLMLGGAAVAAGTGLLSREVLAAPPPRRSGMPWNTGMYNPNRDPEDTVGLFEDDEAWLGHKLDHFTLFWGQGPTNATVADLGSDEKEDENRRRMAAFLSKDIAIWLAVPLLAEVDRGKFGRTKNTDYESYFEAVGRAVAQARPADYAGRDVWYRVGWEMNGDTYPWSALDGGGPAGFKTAYTDACKAIRSVDDKAKFMLNFLKRSEIPPGDLVPDDDSVVQVIATDYYDNRDGGQLWQTGRDNKDNEETTFDKAAAQVVSAGNPIGIRRWRDFAISRGKGFAVPEWGLTNFRAAGKATVPYSAKEEWPPEQPGLSPRRPWTDRTHFIDGMHGFFVETKGLMGENFRGESYFNRKEVHQLNPLLMTPNGYNGFTWKYHERSANLYRQLFQPTA